MLKISILFSLLILAGCITVYECEGKHKETYNNISPTTQHSETINSGDKPPSNHSEPTNS
ncbi:hypothetical protein MTZ49_07455 [Entomomonas sp. E2T0]|uniref:hypothetical protein n=1 Tax=Entomomonas sp. E2T0 TaxID=2930213 RepID=UPI0022282705|nr:hypothetical protein [Entomomonas sp. E2T0]UYZ85374.1 hypothetical protein MTZ49_07455 [Entomomonas sp. E2T0]